MKKEILSVRSVCDRLPLSTAVFAPEGDPDKIRGVSFRSPTVWLSTKKDISRSWNLWQTMGMRLSSMITGDTAAASGGKRTMGIFMMILLSS